MEMMPYHPERDSGGSLATWAVGLPIFGPFSALNDWRPGLPVLTGARSTRRELRIEEAPALFEHLTSEEVSRFISAPPAGVEGFEGWAPGSI